MSRRNRQPLSLAKLARAVQKAGNENKTVVTLSTVTDDARLYTVPKISVSISFTVKIVKIILGFYETSLVLK